MIERHVLVADWFAPDFEIERRLFEPHCISWSLPTSGGPALTKEEQVQQLLRRIDAAPRIDAVAFVLAPLTDEVINALPKTCRHLQRVGIGLDQVDLAAARARGMTIDNTPDYATEE